MTRSEVLVDGVGRVDVPRVSVELDVPTGPRQELAVVEFQGGRAAYLDMSLPRSAVWVEVLESLRANNQPAYVEIDTETRVVTELLLPLTVAVVGIEDADDGGDLSVELAISQAPHYLRRSNPDFEALLGALRTAMDNKNMVVVTESAEGSEIIHVRVLEGVDTGGLE